ncbi:polyprenyl diphosphate synthase [Candidatus Vampirococcus lugosii]|uniref:UDP-diphosphate synthase n=1 Tax=Candidatus Vampirococcus lugosii TaxID=2789015 RepID=A0ABS5QMR7_9BACT|nr:polyprenyl diphosphate synthase [Candidatus Vampirococcus lugosii]MBS8122492.1 UDP-diphosphate synthase [Candidatus Vampirococcus lugosii]
MSSPRHIGFIPDGNRTWAKSKGIHKFFGHLEGFNNVISLVKYVFANTDVEVFSVWGLSTENSLSRNEDELEYLFKLYEKIPSELDDFLQENKINFKLVGNRDGLPGYLTDFFVEKEKKFNFSGSNKTFVLAVNYGGRDEIIRGVKSLISDNVNCGNLVSKLDSDLLSKYLDFSDLPLIDLVIRTKGNKAKRSSGFMLWWIGYAELYFSDKLCPDFTSEDLEQVLEWFCDIQKDRNFGK